MVLVDTSVWVAFFRRTDLRIAAALEALLDDGAVVLAAPVRVELLSGASAQSLTAIRRGLSALPVFMPTPDTWKLLDTWTARAVRRGERFGAMDLLIGALAAERGATVWSLDRDFARMARLRLVKLFAVPRDH